MKKCCIFDLDGTLVNSLDDLADSCNYILSSKGLPIFEKEKYKKFVGDGIYKLIERILPQNMKDKKTVEGFKSIFDEHYNAHCFDKTYVYDGIIELLELLKADGFTLAVLSNKPHEFASIMVDKFFDKGTFDYVLGKKNGMKAKPDPDGVYEILTGLSQQRETTVLIGDSDIDVYTGENASITVIGALWGFRGAEELLGAGTEFLANSPDDIYGIIKNIEY